MFISVKILPSQQVREAPSVSDSATAMVVNFLGVERQRSGSPVLCCPLLQYSRLLLPGQSIPARDPAETLL